MVSEPLPSSTQTHTETIQFLCIIWIVVVAVASMATDMARPVVEQKKSWHSIMIMMLLYCALHRRILCVCVHRSFRILCGNICQTNPFWMEHIKLMSNIKSCHNVIVIVRTLFSFLLSFCTFCTATIFEKCGVHIYTVYACIRGSPESFIFKPSIWCSTLHSHSKQKMHNSEI